ncbi:MAG TPA: septation protein SepH [Streptosporangiaceae bacterium]|nr:septation protein SepH [Streptosporangiaceae bacterium]
MQELRLVAVSEDGTYAILAVPGRSGRFLLPIDDRLRTVAKGQFSRLAQYEIEVENPLRPKEIQERIRAGETAEEIADTAGIPPDKIRRFEGPILAERQYQAEQAQRATIPGRGDSGPGPRLGDIVAERLNRVGANAETAEWDSRKRQDGNWQILLRFTVGSRPSAAEWIYDPRKRHVMPDDEEAIRLCLPQEEWAAITLAERQRATATVTPIGSRQHAQYGDAGRDGDRWGAPALPRSRAAGHDSVATDAAATGAGAGAPAGTAAGEGPAATAATAAAGRTDQPEPAAVPPKKATGGRSRRASVPSWDEIMFGTSRQQD